MGTPRVLCIGLDALDNDLLGTWGREGKLPTLQKLMNGNTAMGRVSNPIGVVAGAVWPCFASATSPAVHGQYWWEQIKSGTYEVVNNFKSIDVAPFWQALVPHGKKMAVVDVLFMPLLDDMEGVQIHNWHAHDLAGPFAARPVEVEKYVRERYGSDQVGFCDHFMDRNGNDLVRLTTVLKERIDHKTDLCQQLLRDESFDLLMAVFGESHCIGHHGWRLHDPFHAGYNADERDLAGDPLERIYRSLDAAVGKLLDSATPTRTSLCWPATGWGPSTTLSISAIGSCTASSLGGTEFTNLGQFVKLAHSPNRCSAASEKHFCTAAGNTFRFPIAAPSGAYVLI